jgi:hypothetical protein
MNRRATVTRAAGQTNIAPKGARATRTMTIWQKLGVGLGALMILAALPNMGFAADAAHPAGLFDHCHRALVTVKRFTVNRFTSPSADCK